MAEKKTDDPSVSEVTDETSGSASPKPRRTRVRRNTARAKAATQKTEVELLEESFAALSSSGEALVHRFYIKLFEDYPELEPLFEGVSVAGQEKKLLASLVLLVQNLHKPDVLKEYLTGLGARHTHYGVEPEDYAKVAETLLSVMAEFAGDIWTDEIQQAWTNTLNNVATIMLDAYEPVEADEMEVTESKQSTNQEIAIMRAMINGAMTAMMTIDRDFNITYVNDATVTMLQEHEDLLQQVFPGFKATGLVGQNIDQFHKNPAHQRKLLADPNNLPYSTDIQVGPLCFNLNVTALMSDDGKYLGNALEWNNVTTLRTKERDVARLQSAISGATTALMMCDENRVITYCNPAVVSLLQNRITELRKVFPGLDLSKIIGTSIDSFHRDPSHQARILGDVNNLPYQTQIELVGLHFDLNATAILDDEGNLLGNMVEWKDITEQKQGEVAIQNLITSAQAGQLKERIDESDYEGFMRNVASGINNLMDAILEPIEETIRISESLAAGTLTEKINSDYQGMFGDLAAALNNSIVKMAETVGEITETTASIASAASEISQGNLDLSQRTEEQASSLEETAASMEELTSTVRQNSDNAAQANQLAASAREQAEKGGSVIKSAIDAMAAISQSSKKVADIIGVIDEIAFQTNLLALNAAVEAARAGEQGRGFAVVASEVRNLAQRSAAAAKEIKELINDSGEKVKEGSMLVDESGRTLEDIVNGAKKVGDIISEIAAAGVEQTQGIGQINTAISQMDQMTQQNAALVEQAAAASQSLDEQSKTLQRLMEFFETGQQVDVPQSTKPAPVKTKPSPAAKPAAPAPRPSAEQADDEWDEF